MPRYREDNYLIEGVLGKTTKLVSDLKDLRGKIVFCECNYFRNKETIELFQIFKDFYNLVNLY